MFARTYYSDYCPKGGAWVVFDEPLSFTTPSKKAMIQGLPIMPRF